MPELPSIEQLHRELEVCEAADLANLMDEFVVIESLADKKIYCSGPSYRTFGIPHPIIKSLAKNEADFCNLAVTALPARIRDVLRLMELVREYGLRHFEHCPMYVDPKSNIRSCTCGLAARLAELKGGEG